MFLCLCGLCFVIITLFKYGCPWKYVSYEFGNLEKKYLDTLKNQPPKNVMIAFFFFVICQVQPKERQGRETERKKERMFKVLSKHVQDQKPF